MAHTLPDLGYALNALEPHIDALTMEIHHGRHHQAYITNLNNAIAGKADLEAKSALDLITHLAAVPDDIRGAVRNNGGGHVNHSFFWKVIAPGGAKAPPAISRPPSTRRSVPSMPSRKPSRKQA